MQLVTDKNQTQIMTYTFVNDV